MAHEIAGHTARCLSGVVGGTHDYHTDLVHHAGFDVEEEVTANAVAAIPHTSGAAVGC